MPETFGDDLLQPPPARGGLALPQGFLDTLPTMVRGADAKGRCSYANAALLSFHGHGIEQELGDGWLSAMHPADRAECVARYRAAVAGPHPLEYEYRLRHHDGAYRWIVDRMAPILAESQVTGFVSFCFDATDQREADNARREVEEQVRLLSLATLDMVWNWDERTNRVIHNQAFTTVLGEVPGPLDATLQWWRARVHPADLDRVLEEFHTAMQAGHLDFKIIYRIRRRTGQWCHVEDQARLVRDLDGKCVRVLGALRDITKRKNAEEERERFVRILEATTDVVAMAHPSGEILHLNEAGWRLLGWDRNQPLSAHKIADLHPGWANEIIAGEGLPQALAGGVWSGESALLTPDREVPVLQVLLSHASAGGEVEFISTILRDISERKREEIARMESTNRYDAAVRASGQILFDWDSSTNDITYGGDVEHFLGFTTAELAGGVERFRELLHPEDRAGFDEEIARVIATRDPFRFVCRVLRKDGREIRMDAKGYFFLDREGHFGRMVGFFADVTTQHHAQDALGRAHDYLEHRVVERTAELQQANALVRERARQQEAVANLGHKALAGADLPSILADATRLVRETLGVDACAVFEHSQPGSELRVTGSAGWPEGTQLPPVGAGANSEAGYTLLTGEAVISEDLAQEHRFQVSGPAHLIGARSAISAVIHTGQEAIAVLCAYSTQLQRFNSDHVHFLDGMANVLTAAIDRQRADESIRLARQQAESANRAKSEFLSRMSHELRTPLNAILGFTQLLEMEAPTGSQAESIGHITRAGAHLLALINQVLDIARIESGRLALTAEVVEIGAVLRESVELIQPLALRHRITISRVPMPPPDIHAYADRQRLKQVFLNLLSNAVKYNREGGSVTIHIEPQGENICVSIHNTGIGIHPDKMNRLFVPFERLGAELTEVEGTGIGLALAQRIVVSLRGKLTVESVHGEGATFYVRLPAANPMQFAAAGSDTPPAPVQKLRVRTVLYIEDQDLNLRLVEQILQRQPAIRLISAIQGSLGLDLAREHRPDLILLDLNLPDISGDEVLRRLKADPELQSIPVIMVSADAVSERIEQLLSLGAQSYLTKPYRVQDFLALVNGALPPP